jgi:hypothetical protein
LTALVASSWRAIDSGCTAEGLIFASGSVDDDPRAARVGRQFVFEQGPEAGALPPVVRHQVMGPRERLYPAFDILQGVTRARVANQPDHRLHDREDVLRAMIHLP